MLFTKLVGVQECQVDIIQHGYRFQEYELSLKKSQEAWQVEFILEFRSKMREQVKFFQFIHHQERTLQHEQQAFQQIWSGNISVFIYSQIYYNLNANIQQLRTSQMINYQQAANNFHQSLAIPGTNESQLVKQISNFTNEQLQQIQTAYFQSFNKSLISKIKWDTSFNFERLLVKTMTPRYDLWAECIHHAIAGLGTDEKRLIYYVFMSDDTDKQNLRMAYQNKYKKSLDTAIAFDVAPIWTFGKLLQKWLKNTKTNNGNPQQLAEQLHKAASGPGTKESVFIQVLTSTDHDLFNQVVSAYNKKYMINLRAVIKREFSGHTELAMLAAYDFDIHPANLCAQLIHHAVKGMGTDDQLLMNVTALFRDRYYDWIRQAYPGNIVRAIKGDTSGHYEDALLGLWNLQA
uniref:Annexin 12 n=1 Tax=Spironucleus barkhanus TaxID=103874 RepID=A0A142C664_SPIBA|nr:annexin 12 [Spironucleus barkhanus]